MFTAKPPPFRLQLRAFVLGLFLSCLGCQTTYAAPASAPMTSHPAARIYAEALAIADAMQDEVEAARLRLIVAVSMARQGEVEAALAIANDTADEVGRMTTLAVIAAVLSQSGDPGRALHLVGGLEAPAHALGPGRSRARILENIANAQARSGRIDAAIATALAIGDGIERMLTLEQVSREATDAAQLEVMLAEITAIQPGIDTRYDAQVFNNYRSGVLVSFAGTMAFVGQLDQAAEIAASITDPDDREMAQGQIAAGLARAGDTRAALEAIGQIEGTIPRDMVLQQIGNMLVEDQNPDLARLVYPEILRLAREPDASDMLQRSVHLFLQDAVALAGPDAASLSGDARRTIESLQSPAIRAASLASLAAILTEAGNTSGAEPLFREALATAREIESTSQRARTLSGIAINLWRSGQIVAAGDAFNEAIMATTTMSPVYFATAAQTIAIVAQAILETGDVERAIQVYSAGMEMAGEQSSDEDRFIVARTIIDALARAEF